MYPPGITGNDCPTSWDRYAFSSISNTELLALLSFSKRWLGTGAHSLSLPDPSCSVDKLRLSTQVVKFVGSANTQSQNPPSYQATCTFV